MEIVAALFKIAEYSLGIYKTHQSRKYLEQVLELKRDYYEEQKKPEEERNHALMDNIVNELCLISEEITRFGASGAEDRS